jgi:hypothetical protein
MRVASPVPDSRPEGRSGNARSGDAASINPPELANGSVCRSIDDQIDRINARMRQPYTAREGEWYRARLRELDDQRWDSKCRLLRNH